MDKKNWVVIKCPHCGAEYLAAEVFMPDDFAGRPDELVRDSLGKIIYADYQEDYEPLASTSFTCEFCNKPFVVEPVISYKVRKEDPEKDFSRDSVSLLD